MHANYFSGNEIYVIDSLLECIQIMIIFASDRPHLFTIAGSSGSFGILLY